jgi:hypothetical protein
MRSIVSFSLDPIEFRMRNELEKDPVSGHEFFGRSMREAYRLGAEKFGCGYTEQIGRPNSLPSGWIVSLLVTAAPLVRSRLSTS